MVLIIQCFGVLIIIAGLSLTVKPALILGFMQRNHEKAWLHVVAIVVRVLLGALLLTTASISRFPLLVTIFGWVSILAAILIIVIGPRRFSLLVSKILKIIQPWARFGGVVSMAFGVFLVIAYL